MFCYLLAGYLRGSLSLVYLVDLLIKNKSVMLMLYFVGNDVID